MKVAILIPDRGDRPAFLKNCLRMIEAQTLKPEYIHLVDYKPVNDEVDITPRYYHGYQLLSKYDTLDLIAFIENDDWYSPLYLETMIREWDKAGRPDLFGTNYTIYYHIGLRKYYKMSHPDRASAMNTIIKPKIPQLLSRDGWPVDNEPFTDMWLWTKVKSRITFCPESHISIGIKHGFGKTGGQSHTTRLHRYEPPRGSLDNGFLKSIMDEESFNFYSQFSQPSISNNCDFLPSQID